MFSKKRFVIFISKRFIDSGWVAGGKSALFQEGEALQYNQETFAETLRKLGVFSRKKVRVVLSEELVYVTRLSFPRGTLITRELVLEKAEESIPEDLRKTDWDFQALSYAESSGGEDEVVVQVAVVERSFSALFRQALLGNEFSIEGILPESYLLACLEREGTDVSVIVERDRETTVLCAVAAGLVIATQVEEGEVTPDRLERFLDFVVSHKGATTKRIIFSHFGVVAPEPFSEIFGGRYEIVVRDYNPLVVAWQEKVSGKDEDILNIEMLPQSEKKSWWRIW